MAARTDRHLVILAWATGLAGLALLAPLLSRGTSGGDEGGVIQFLATYRHGGWAALTGGGGDHDYLAHRLFWFGEKLLWEDLLRLLVPASFLRHPAVYNALIVLDDTLLVLGAFLLAVLHLRKRVGSATGFLAAASLFIASSGISLFTGGFSECAMCLMVLVMVVQCDRTSVLAPWQFCLLVLAGLGLVVSKLYAAPFVLILALLLPERRQRMVYSAIFLLVPFLWLAIQSEVRAAAPSGMLDFYVSLMRGHGLADAMAFYLSLSFGVLPCFPLLFLVAFAGADWRFAVTVKILAVVSVSALLLPFSFWAGPGGLAGPRYIVPFLLIFLPEMSEALHRLAQSRRRPVLLLIPAAALLFLPCLEFRNSLVTRYANDERSVEYVAWPHTELAMHPAVMAWSVVAAKLERQPTLEVSADMRMRIPVRDIFPMTTLSRVIYVLTVKGSATPQIQTAKTMLRQYHMDDVRPWAALRWLLAALLLGGLTMAAWPRPKPR